jgi:hypothetical protein
VSGETTAILAIAADRFLTTRHERARDVFGAIARGLDPRAPGHIVCIRDGRLFDVELPGPDIGRGPEFVACLLRAEHVVGLEEQLDVAPPAPEEAPFAAPGPDALGVRLWACEAWLEGRSAVRVSERYVSFPSALQWSEPQLSHPELDRFLFDYEAAFAPTALTDDQARVILEHKGCRVTDFDLDRALDRWVVEFGDPDTWDIGPETGPPFGPS